MTFSLVEMTQFAGGEVNILQIVPGTTITGKDETFQGTFSAELAGTFDCRTRMLTGTLKNGVYLTPIINTPVRMAGDLSGLYEDQTDAGVAGFTGAMGPLTSPDFDAFGPLSPNAMCTWGAVLSGDAVESSDAGRDAG